MAAYYNEYDLGKFLKIPHRQFSTLEAWIRDQWNEPSRSDHYLMKLIATVVAAVSGKEQDHTAFKIPWEFKFHNQQSKLPVDDPNYRSKAEQRTMAFLGVNW